MTNKSSVSLTDEQYAFAENLTEEGHLSNVSADLQQGVDLPRQRMEADAQETEALEVLLYRRADGPFVSGTEMDARIEVLIADKRRELALGD